MMKLRIYFWIISVLCLSLPAWGVEYSAVLSTSVELSDNIKLVTDQKEYDTLQALSLSGSVVEERKTFQTNASFTLQQDHYYSGTYDGELTLSTGLGLLNFDVIEEFLSWHTSYSRIQTLNDPLKDDHPGNRGYRDTVSTGPSISYILSPTVQLSGEGSFIFVENSQQTAADTERASLSVGLAHQLNSITSMGVNGQYELMLEGDGGEKYNRYQLGLSFLRDFVDGNLNLSAGRTLLDQEYSLDIESTFVSLTFTREKLWLHDVTLSYLEDVSDSSIGFTVDLPGSISSVQQGYDIVKRKASELRVERQLGVYSYNLGFTWEYEDYSIQNDDEKGKTVNLTISRDFFSNLNAGVDIEFSQNDYLGQPTIGKENTRTYQVMADHQFSQALSIGGFIQHEIRKNAKNAVREYEELSAGLTISWVLF